MESQNDVIPEAMMQIIDDGEEIFALFEPHRANRLCILAMPAVVVEQNIETFLAEKIEIFERAKAGVTVAMGDNHVFFAAARKRDVGAVEMIAVKRDDGDRLFLLRRVIIDEVLPLLDDPSLTQREKMRISDQMGAKRKKDKEKNEENENKSGNDA